MNFTISAEQKSLQLSIAEFCKAELNNNVSERDKLNLFPRDLWHKCAGQKLTGLTIGTEYGGAGLDPISTILAMEAFGYGCEDGGLSFSVAAHLFATVIPIWKYASEEQKSKLLPSLCSGKKHGANAITEDENGSDVFNMNTTAIKHNDGYILNGTKTYITNGSEADTILVYALTDKEKGFFGGITPFIIDSKITGFSVERIFNKMGLKTCIMSQLKFDNVFVPKENILNHVGSGATIFNYSMDWERVGIAALHVGVMQKLIEQVIAFAKNRQSQGESLSKKQVIAHRISDMKVRLEASRLLTYKAAFGLENDKLNTLNASIAKVFVSESLIKTATETMHIFGAKGYLIEYDIERTVRDSLASTIYSGTSEIQRNIISKYLEL
jgi:alkylation response protein AidB-like acyl-CoA dehydrogenase